MRALLNPNFDFSQHEFCIADEDDLHHLKNVLRVRPQEKILLLNGKGSGTITAVEKIERQHLLLRGTGIVETHQRPFEIHLGVGMVKRDAWGEILKIALQLGVAQIFPLKTEYSPLSSFGYQPEKNQKILKNALEQSNSFWAPEIHTPIELSDLAWDGYTEIIYCDQVSGGSHSFDFGHGPVLLLVGPEGGFSSKEIDLLKSKNHVYSLSLSPWILRTETAVAAGLGYLRGPKG